jgi:ribosomal protein S18 acetylase RimI-like enzyme
MTTTSRTELDRLRRLRRQQLEQITNRNEPFAHGTAFFTPEHPTKWDVNLLLVDRIAPGVGAQELIDEAERLQGPAGLAHRRLELAEGGDRLRGEFVAAGWSIDHLLLMVLRPGSDRRGGLSAASVREVGFEDVRPLAERWPRENTTPDQQDQAAEIADADADRAERLSARMFLAERDGQPGAYALLLRVADGVAEIDQVYTAPEHRGAGLASAVVRAAIAAATERGDDLIYLLADAEDWPFRLYERLGFETVGTRYDLTRKPPD